MMILSLIDNIKNTITENPYFIYAIGGCVGLLIVLVILLIIVNSKNKKNKNNANESVETPLEENAEQLPVEEVLDDEEPTAEVESEDEPSADESLDEDDESTDSNEEETDDEEEVEEEPQPVENPNKLYIPVPSRKRKSNGKRKKAKRAPRIVNGKYEVYTDGTAHYFTLKASNGEVLIKSEAYSSKDSVLLAVEAIKRNAEVGTISVRQDKHGLYQFVLIAKNHRTLVMSANYSTEKRAQSASESFKRFATSSPVVEIEEIVESNKEEVKPENIVDKKGGRLGVLSNENGYYYVLKASNGEVLVTSHYYKLEASALNAMARFKEAVDNGKFYIEKDKRENYQFKLFGANGRLVCVGQIYATKALAMASLNSVCSFVKLALPFDEQNLTQ